MVILVEVCICKIPKKSVMWKIQYFSIFCDNNSSVLIANWKISMLKIIYSSRPITWWSRNPRGTCHVSKNVSWSWTTLKSKKSKNRTCLIWLPPPPASGVTRDYWDVSHTPGQILQLKKREGPPVTDHVPSRLASDWSNSLWEMRRGWCLLCPLSPIIKNSLKTENCQNIIIIQGEIEGGRYTKFKFQRCWSEQYIKCAYFNK